jgi:hypothetical protein
MTADENAAKEIMIAYIAAMGQGAEIMFRKKGQEAAVSKDFAEVWQTILKTLSAPN